MRQLQRKIFREKKLETESLLLFSLKHLIFQSHVALVALIRDIYTKRPIVSRQPDTSTYQPVPIHELDYTLLPFSIADVGNRFQKPAEARSDSLNDRQSS